MYSEDAGSELYIEGTAYKGGKPGLNLLLSVETHSRFLVSDPTAVQSHTVIRGKNVLSAKA